MPKHTPREWQMRVHAVRPYTAWRAVRAVFVSEKRQAALLAVVLVVFCNTAC